VVSHPGFTLFLFLLYYVGTGNLFIYTCILVISVIIYSFYTTVIV